MWKSIKRNIAFIAGYLVLCALYFWFTPIVEVPACYVADGVFVALGLAGLAWANQWSFPRIRWRWLRILARTGTVVLLFVALEVTAVLYGWRIQPLLGRLITRESPYAGPSAGTIFQPFAFSSNAEQNALTMDWYSSQLRALQEGPFFTLSSDRSVRAFRFTCLRSFHNPFCVVITFNTDGSAIATFKASSGAGGYDPGKVWRRKHSTIRRRDAQEFEALIQAEAFWTLPATVTEMGFDGSRQ
jgi:hypothetical protein